MRNIDLSANLLGSNQNLNALHPDLATGGKLLSSMLSEPSCKVRSLNVSWNMIRFDSGVALVNSLKRNSSLTYLNVSYNALGEDGGQALGQALHVNKTIRVLILANNQFNSRACFTIVTGMRFCPSLAEIDLVRQQNTILL